jgi:glycine betaine/choline ABC-type transport system substrate-binding protein
MKLVLDIDTGCPKEPDLKKVKEMLTAFLTSVKIESLDKNKDGVITASVIFTEKEITDETIVCYLSEHGYQVSRRILQ